MICNSQACILFRELDENKKGIKKSQSILKVRFSNELRSQRNFRDNKKMGKCAVSEYASEKNRQHTTINTRLLVLSKEA